jgi:hypothetical protein
MSLVILFQENFTQNLNSAVRARLPRALASSLNKMVAQTRADLVAAERNELTLTRSFVPNSTQFEAARSAGGLNTFAEVGILERVKFAERLIEGGTRAPERSQYIAVPIGAKSNGRVSRGMRPSVILSKPGYFIFDNNGKPVIAKRMRDDSIKVMYALKRKTEYDEAPYLDFDAVVERSASQHDFEEILVSALERAMAQ